MRNDEMNNNPAPRTIGNVWKGVVTFCIGFIAFMFVIGFVSSLVESVYKANHTDPSSTPNHAGVTMEAETFLAECNGAAAKEVGDRITPEQMSAYCQCTWDQGLATLGTEAWNKMLLDYDSTQPMPAEFNSIINLCVRQELLNV